MTLSEAKLLLELEAHNAKPTLENGEPCPGMFALGFVGKMFPTEFEVAMQRLIGDDIEAGFSGMMNLIERYRSARANVRVLKLLRPTG